MAKKKNFKLHIKSGDTVKVIAGDYKGEIGKITKVFPKENRAIVEGLNMVKRHVRPTAESPGGVFEKEAPIHISNLMLVDSNEIASRIKIVREPIEGREGKTKRVRISKKTEEVID